MKFLSMFTIIVAFLTIVLIGCNEEKNPVKGEDEIDYGNITNIEYTKHVQALFDKYCVSCHGSQQAEAGLRLDSWENIFKGSNFGEAVIPFDSENSLLIEMLSKLRVNGVLTPHPSDQGEAALDTVKINFLKRWIDEGAKNDNQQVAYSNSTNLLYVCSQGEAIVNIIDADALVVIRNVDLGKLGFPKSAKPHHIAFDPAGENWFVSCIDNQVNKVLKFSVATNDLVGEETSFIPALLAHHPTENILYISRFMDAQNPTNSIHVIDSQTMTPIDNGNNGDILLPPGLQIPHAMMISHDGNYVYTCSFTEDQFLVVNHAQKDFEDAIILGNDRTPVQGVVSPDDQKVYVSCIGTGEIVAIDVSNSANRFLADSVTVGGQPWHLVTNDDGSKLYGANLALNQVSVINTSDMSFQNVGTGDGTDGLAQPHGIEYYKASDGSERVFITGRNVSGAYQPRYDLGDNDKVGTVVVLDPQTNTIIRVIEIEDFGSGIKLLQK